MCHPLTVILLDQSTVDLRQSILQIADNGSICVNVFVDFGSIDIHMYNLGIFCKLLRIACNTVGESCSHGNQKITLADSQIGSLGTVHTDHTGISVALSVKSTFSHQSITYRCIQKFCKLCHFIGCIRRHCTTAKINVRLLSITEQFHYILDILFRIAIDSLHCLRCLGSKLTYCGSYILGDIYQYRAGTAALSNMKCLTDGIRKNFYILYNISMLGNRHGHTGNVHLLERILSKQRKIYIGSNCYHRNGIHICGSNTRYQIGSTGAAGSHTYANLTGGTCISVSSMGGSLLMGC